jgi:diadenosine tetraphosphate (Ap4A) HIT family hydrolase
MDSAQHACELCGGDGGRLVARTPEWRIVLADEPEYPGLVRVIWNRHVREMTDLAPSGRERLMAAVWVVEAAQRRTLGALKINLASLGNMVPHLHWHLVPRFADDPHYPQAIWSARQRPADAAQLAARRALEPQLAAAIAAALPVATVV